MHGLGVADDLPVKHCRRYIVTNTPNPTYVAEVGGKLTLGSLCAGCDLEVEPWLRVTSNGIQT